MRKTTMNIIYSTCGRYGVQFIEQTEGYLAVAVQNDGLSYGGISFWFKVGIYKDIKNAVRYSTKKMAQFNIQLNIPPGY